MSGDCYSVPLKMKLYVFRSPERIWQGKFEKKRKKKRKQQQKKPLKTYPSNHIQPKKVGAVWFNPGMHIFNSYCL